MQHYLKKLSILVKSYFAPKGVVGPHMSQQQWDEEFANSKWAYLSKANQREHYDCIIDMYNQHGNNGSMLDIGCGVGLLYRYFMDTSALKDDQYFGIDISTVAINEAKETCKSNNFSVVDYETHHINKKFDVVIFNETLYYFNHAGKTLQKCIDENLTKQGVIIISMCDHERHDLIWELISKKYTVIDTRKSANEEGISWTIKVLRP